MSIKLTFLHLFNCCNERFLAKLSKSNSRKKCQPEIWKNMPKYLTNLPNKGETAHKSHRYTNFINVQSQFASLKYAVSKYIESFRVITTTAWVRFPPVLVKMFIVTLKSPDLLLISNRSEFSRRYFLHIGRVSPILRIKPIIWHFNRSSILE